MHLESRITWEKLAIELELLAQEEPITLVPLLIGLNSLLWSEDCQEPCTRQINFMSYELQSRAANLSECERFTLLNDYLFNEKGFQISNATTENEILIKNVLANRRGSAVMMAILYLHFAAELQIPVYLLQISEHFMVKWVRSGRPSFVDLTNQGLLLSEADMLEILNRTHSQDPRLEALEAWKAPRILRCYMTALLKIYELKSSDRDLHTCYNVLLKLDPSNLKILGYRALLRQKLGFTKDALLDLKRYFSFVERNKAPQKLQVAFFELQGLLEETATAADTVH